MCIYSKIYFVPNEVTFVEMVPSAFLSNISKAALNEASSSGLSLSAILMTFKPRKKYVDEGFINKMTKNVFFSIYLRL